MPVGKRAVTLEDIRVQTEASRGADSPDRGDAEEITGRRGHPAQIFPGLLPHMQGGH